MRPEFPAHSVNLAKKLLQLKKIEHFISNSLLLVALASHVNNQWTEVVRFPQSNKH